MTKTRLLLLPLCLLPLVLTAAEPTQVNLQITGMKCPVCAKNLKNKLKQCDGVEKVEVNYKEKTATVTLSAERAAEVESLRQVVKAAGFKADEVTPVSRASEGAEVAQ